jgi:hypothetical protein
MCIDSSTFTQRSITCWIHLQYALHFLAGFLGAPPNMLDIDFIPWGAWWNAMVSKEDI